MNITLIYNWLQELKRETCADKIFCEIQDSTLLIGVRKNDKEYHSMLQRKDIQYGNGEYIKQQFIYNAKHTFK